MVCPDFTVYKHSIILARRPRIKIAHRIFGNDIRAIGETIRANLLLKKYRQKRAAMAT
jgi:hypothetical protein